MVAEEWAANLGGTSLAWLWSGDWANQWGWPAMMQYCCSVWAFPFHMHWHSGRQHLQIVGWCGGSLAKLSAQCYKRLVEEDKSCCIFTLSPLNSVVHESCFWPHWTRVGLNQSWVMCLRQACSSFKRCFASNILGQSDALWTDLLDWNRRGRVPQPILEQLDSSKAKSAGEHQDRGYWSVGKSWQKVPLVL